MARGRSTRAIYNRFLTFPGSRRNSEDGSRSFNPYNLQYSLNFSRIREELWRPLRFAQHVYFTIDSSHFSEELWGCLEVAHLCNLQQILHFSSILEELRRPLRFAQHVYFTIGSSHFQDIGGTLGMARGCLLYTSPSPRDLSTSRMPSSA